MNNPNLCGIRCFSLRIDSNSDYGFERQSDGSCTPAFWFVPSATSRDCVTADSFLNTTGYNKLICIDKRTENNG